jgi:ribosomal protein L44E|tara:strand:+ start:248 stop:412 length:165 start_codon:yes stop_codon:yes gene_type:complete
MGEEKGANGWSVLDPKRKSTAPTMKIILDNGCDECAYYSSAFEEATYCPECDKE